MPGVGPVVAYFGVIMIFQIVTEGELNAVIALCLQTSLSPDVENLIYFDLLFTCRLYHRCVKLHLCNHLPHSTFKVDYLLINFRIVRGIAHSPEG